MASQTSQGAPSAVQSTVSAQHTVEARWSQESWTMDGILEPSLNKEVIPGPESSRNRKHASVKSRTAREYRSPEGMARDIFGKAGKA